MHCDIWKNKGKEDSPSPEQWKTVFSDLRAWLGPVYTAISGGEALLKPFTIDLVAHSSSIGLFLEILTHGYWDDQSKIERLALANPWRVTISLDGMGETHSKVRGRDNFFEKSCHVLSPHIRATALQAVGHSMDRRDAFNGCIGRFLLMPGRRTRSS